MPKTSIAALALLLALTGCSTAPAAPADDRPLVLTTFTVLADMAQQVAGDHVRVASITKVGAEIHGYEPTPSDVRTAEEADLILDNGLGLERWLEDFLAHLDTPHVVLTEGIEPIEIAEGGYEGRPNPHAWMSPVAAETYVANIAAALAGLVPEHAADFEANAAAYTQELRAVADGLRETVDRLDESQRVLLTCEGAFSYLARDLGLHEAYLWPVNADTQGTPQQIAAAITLVRERDVPSVFCETTVSDKSMQQVARESGARFAGSLYVDSLSEPGGPVPSYLDLLRHDLDLIVDGLGG